MGKKQDLAYGYFLRNFSAPVSYHATQFTDLGTVHNFIVAMADRVVDGHIITNDGEYATIQINITETIETDVLTYFGIDMSYMGNPERNVVWSIKRALADGFTSIRITNDGR